MKEKFEKIILFSALALSILIITGLFLKETSKIGKISKIETFKENAKKEIYLEGRKLASGKQVYEIITDKIKDPQIIEVELDPLDVEIGKIQTVKVKIKTKADVIRAEDYVLGTAILDENKIDFPLTLKKAEGEKELITTWEGKWERKFSIEKHYQIRIFVKNAKGEDFVTLSFGTHCPDVPPGGDYTVATSCTFANTIDGVDNGDLIINSGCTLTINAGQTIVFNPGKKVVVNGALAINKGNPGGQLKKTYLWMIDSDSDGYSPSLTQYAQDSAPPGGKRRSSMKSITSTDCYDQNANAYPGQTNYFTTHRGDGSFDYDCDGQISKSGCSYVDYNPSGYQAITYATNWSCRSDNTCQCNYTTEYYYTSCGNPTTISMNCGESHESETCESEYISPVGSCPTSCTYPNDYQCQPSGCASIVQIDSRMVTCSCK
jgi:hypothetical protein